MHWDQKDREYVLEMAQKHQVKFIRLWFTDILGHLKSFAILVEDLEEALEEGIGFDGSVLEGYARMAESDKIALPDPTTFRILPWRPKEQGAVARMFCEILNPDRSPYECDPRWVLRRNLAHLAEWGYTFYVGPEVEYFYFQSAELPLQTLDAGGYFDLTPLDAATDLRRDTVLMLEEMGIGVRSTHHEGGPSQHEVDLQYADALTMADNLMTFRLVVKEVAFRHNCYATFMPKPLPNAPGSAMHTNLSLFREGRNAFFDPHDPYHLSKVAQRFMAGLLHHARSITLVTNQWVNSYKRLVPGFEAPLYVSWALQSRSDLIRVPAYRQGREEAVRIEYRSPDPACNPYLVFAVLLAAGLDGLRNDYPLPPPMERSVLEMTERERREQGIQRLPWDLHEAIEAAEESPLLRQALGETLFTKLLENKRIEWERYRSHVSDYELQRYLPIL